MLDNVIDLNMIPVPQAERTNARYRGIGLGTFGWHHLLALKSIRWESDEAVEFADKLYEKIAYLTIQASLELAKEKGAYPLFDGSDWHTGAYFETRQYDSEDGMNFAEQVARKWYAKWVFNGSRTEFFDFDFSRKYGKHRSYIPKELLGRKKDYKIPVTVPDLNPETTWFYKSAYFIDQHWTLKQNAARQRHIDQGVSLNLYVQNTIKAKELLIYI